jgi:hypothetical protein
MKKIGLIIAGMSLSLLFLAGGVWAADLTITDGNATSGLVYQMSPNVHMDYVVSAATDGFFITSVNEKGNIEYGIVSTYSGYYQHEVDVGKTTATTAANATISGWTKAGAS